jgi:uncharacterized protein (DUF2267 family)
VFKQKFVEIIMETYQDFLEKVRTKGNLKDLKEARNATEVVYRTMRDVMSNEAIDRVGDELDDNAPDKVEDLWEDTNPLVSFLSHIRPNLHISPDNFLVRLRQEANLPGADAETIITAVFSATKDELSQERVQEVAGFLPGKISEMWQAA